MNNNILKFSRLISGNTRILIPGNTRMFTTSSLLTSTVPALLPWYISGFADGEASFGIYYTKTSKFGFQVKYEFTIVQHIRDRALLENIQLFFNNIGGLDKHGKLSVKYRVSSIKDILIIIDHFEKYPLITQKRADFLLFKRAFEIIQRKEHLTSEGFRKILSIKASLNLGLSETLKQTFPEIVPVSRPKIEDQIIPDQYWLAGFVEAEECFYVSIVKSQTKLGYSASLKFQITQHSRDALLMESLEKYFDCGHIYRKSSKDVMNFEVKKLSDLTEKIIPFFKKYPLQGIKKLELECFCQVASLIKSGAHLTKSGLDKIRKIKEEMNTQREPL